MKNLFLVLATLLLAASPARASLQAYNASGLELGILSELQCSTGLTCTIVAGRLNVVSSPSLTGPLTLESGEILSNTVDDTVKIISNDEVTTFQVAGYEAKNAILKLSADEGDDAADTYSLTSDTSNVLTLKNAATSLLSFSATGVQTLADSETFTNASDIVEFASDDEVMTLKLLGFEAKGASLALWADQGDDAADKFALSVSTADVFSIDNNGSAVLSVSAVGAVTATGGIAGDGGDSLVGFKQSQVVASSTSLTAAQCGSTIVYGGAFTMVLPEASTVLGCRYTFIVNAVANSVVNPADGTDQIVLLTNAAGDSITADAIGESVVLEAIGADTWAPVGAEKGTWSDTD